jgi:hypothetical protein
MVDRHDPLDPRHLNSGDNGMFLEAAASANTFSSSPAGLLAVRHNLWGLFLRALVWRRCFIPSGISQWRIDGRDIFPASRSLWKDSLSARLQ